MLILSTEDSLSDLTVCNVMTVSYQAPQPRIPSEASEGTVDFFFQNKSSLCIIVVQWIFGFGLGLFPLLLFLLLSHFDLVENSYSF